MLFSKRAGQIGSENAFRMGAHISQIEKTGHRVIRCNLGEPNFAVPSFIREEVKRQLDLDNAHYSDPQGILSLREAVASHVSERRGIKVTPDRVVIFPGAKPAIGFAEQTYTNPGDEIIYPSPGYPIYESFVKYVEAVPVPLHLSEEKGFSFEGRDLEKLITPKTKLIFLNFPSNPTGGVASFEQLKEIAEVIMKKCSPDVRVYSDEIYEDMIFDGAKFYSIASVPGMEKITIIGSGVSKSYAWTGGRLGWAVFPTVEEAQVFKNLNINYLSCMSAYNQEGARLALTSPLGKEFINQMVAAFTERRDMIVPALNSIPGIKCQMPKGAFYVFPNIAGMCQSLGVLQAFDALPGEKKAKTTPSTMFQMFLMYCYYVATMDRKAFGFLGNEGHHFLRLSIATAKEDLVEAVRIISQASQDKAGFAKFVQEGPLAY